MEAAKTRQKNERFSDASARARARALESGVPPERTWREMADPREPGSASGPPSTAGNRRPEPHPTAPAEPGVVEFLAPDQPAGWTPQALPSRVENPSSMKSFCSQVLQELPMRPLSTFAATSLLLSLSCTNPDAYRRASVIDLDADLAGWEYYSEDPSVPREDVWQVEDGILGCRGTPRGYIYTEEEFENFLLEIEYRWPPGAEPGKGGILLRRVGEHRIWPRSLEAQINAGEAGDFWGLDGYSFEGPADRHRTLDHETLGKLTHLEKMATAEKPAGEWNHYEIEVMGREVSLTINGQLVNEATDCDTTPGHICLTAEGSGIQFRSIRLLPFDPP